MRSLEHVASPDARKLSKPGRFHWSGVSETKGVLSHHFLDFCMTEDLHDKNLDTQTLTHTLNAVFEASK